nr:immunoglobulin heavy chain junction region [Mus musculus]MBK4186682.1 immunoglobulin heavy chain junction region [Mus musculus]MBK4186683.1 immunoglobulin heavy chain junction region [Mus musculus]MBK4186684.1 immunoglobulin heavy chain junction region [Mus musculus]MBK4186686.1 immunoglobulin heavy chain junction region [Mus musculus]
CARCRNFDYFDYW